MHGVGTCGNWAVLQKGDTVNRNWQVWKLHIRKGFASRLRFCLVSIKNWTGVCLFGLC